MSDPAQNVVQATEKEKHSVGWATVELDRQRLLLGHPSNCSSLGNVLNVLVWSQVAFTTLWLILEHRERKGVGSSPPPPDALEKTPHPAAMPPTEAHLQITSACPLPCQSCHIDPAAGGDHVPTATLLERLDDFVKAGVRQVALGGGEPLLHPGLAEIAAGARARGISLGLTSSGLGLDADKVKILQGFSQVNLSLDGLGEDFVESRGYPGAGRVLEGLRKLGAAGVRTGINLVLTRAGLAGLEETAAAAAAAGAREVQLLRLKPVGRARELYAERRLRLEEAEGLWGRIEALIRRYPGMLWRADCGLIPLISEGPLDPARLQTFAIRGCQGGTALYSVDVAGKSHPCSFLPEGGAPKRELAAPCASCSLQAVCRGGCLAVARAAGVLLDPECPKVLRAAVL